LVACVLPRRLLLVRLLLFRRPLFRFGVAETTSVAVRSSIRPPRGFVSIRRFASATVSGGHGTPAIPVVWLASCSRRARFPKRAFDPGRFVLRPHESATFAVQVQPCIPRVTPVPPTAPPPGPRRTCKRSAAMPYPWGGRILKRRKRRPLASGRVAKRSGSIRYAPASKSSIPVRAMSVGCGRTTKIDS
jgi:hypothetical protein